MMELINKEVALISKADKAIAEAKEQSNNYFDEMKAAMEKMGAVANIDDSTITPKGKIPDELADPEGEFPVVEPDVSDMAGDQAMSAVKDQLPQ